MPFELIHFRGSDKIIRRKKLSRDVDATLRAVDDALQGTIQRGELLRQVLRECGWREDGCLNIIFNRRYQYKGFKLGVALDGSFSSYEYLWTGLLRLQYGFDRGKVECGILMLTSARSEKSPFGTSKDLAIVEVEQLYPTITVPVAIAFFDLGAPVISDGEDEGGSSDGTSVQESNRFKSIQKPGSHLSAFTGYAPY